jgi:phosphatidylcholine synthase
VFVPVLLLLHAKLLPPGWGIAVGAVVLLASGYGFSQTAAKVETSDYFFTGFPSYWNLLAFYLFVLEWPPEVNAAIVVALAILVFVPLRYVYPSRTQALSAVTNGLGIAWAALMIWILWRLPEKDGVWIWLSFAFPVYYVLLSLWLDRQSRAKL